jgi:hypothetical protein
LLTLSHRYIKSAAKIGLNDIVTASPQTIASLLEVLGKVKFSNKDYLRLMDNPLMIYSVEQSWDDVQSLIKMGVSLNGKSLPNLRWEFDACLHDQIQGYLDIASHGSQTKSQKDERSFDSYIGIVKQANKLGYKLLPELNDFIKNYENISSENQTMTTDYTLLKKEYEILQKEISTFSLKKQHYLDKIKKTNK